MKLNVANPATGAQKSFEFLDERNVYVVSLWSYMY